MRWDINSYYFNLNLKITQINAFICLHRSLIEFSSANLRVILMVLDLKFLKKLTCLFYSVSLIAGIKAMYLKYVGIKDFRSIVLDCFGSYYYY